MKSDNQLPTEYISKLYFQSGWKWSPV